MTSLTSSPSPANESSESTRAFDREVPAPFATSKLMAVEIPPPDLVTGLVTALLGLLSWWLTRRKV